MATSRGVRQSLPAPWVRTSPRSVGRAARWRYPRTGADPGRCSAKGTASAVTMVYGRVTVRVPCSFMSGAPPPGPSLPALLQIGGRGITAAPLPGHSPPRGAALDAAEVERRVLAGLGRALGRFAMLRPGDRVAVGVSGGKDSLCLLHALVRQRRRLPFACDVVAVTIEQGKFKAPIQLLERQIRALGVEWV